MKLISRLINNVVGFSVAMIFATQIPANAETKIPFTLDWKFEGPSAPYFAAIDNGHFASAGLDVEISSGKGSLFGPY